MDFLKLKKKLRKYLPKWFFNFLIEIVWRKIINPFRMLSKNFKNVYCICDKRKIVFFIIGKNACSSIKKTFYKKKFEDNYSIHKNENRKFFLSKKEKTYFKFAFIRNPFDRVYSCYKSKFINDKKKYSIELNYFYSYLFGYLRNCKNFNDFLFKINKIPNFLADRHFKSQYSLLYKNNKCLVDYVGRFENLEKDFEPIRKKYKLEKLPHFNKSQKNKDEWKDHYTKELADLVYKRYKKDFDLWYPNAYKELIDYINKKNKK